MKTVKVDILNPKAKKLLDDLADLNLISIRKSSKSDFFDALKRLRAKSIPIDSEEITREVEAVRSKRHSD